MSLPKTGMVAAAIACFIIAALTGPSIPAGILALVGFGLIARAYVSFGGEKQGQNDRDHESILKDGD
jgi:hypothetical protein